MFDDTNGAMISDILEGEEAKDEAAAIEHEEEAFKVCLRWYRMIAITVTLA